ncbi:MAG: hypothetical protein GAK30_02972 [Paracidovorax wautersii]|uniref:Uncharacterized protein n=1 Tax=Paracidovorax wautersii TaxID=1177982 RepID=A0A7V8FM09_9BURK|nr:MAG: hypothetical protein GAK30_02972 [Paracidovorax wautersii]
MSVIVTYDLNKEAKRPPIVDGIKRLGAWAKLSESSYALNTQFTPKQIYEALSQYLDSNDQLFVITLSAPWHGQGPQEIRNWLHQNI